MQRGISVECMIVFGFMCLTPVGAMAAEKTKVVVWDERQPAQKEAYPNFLGNQIAEHLSQFDDLEVKSVGLDDPGQGVSKDVLDNCDVLIWWGHARQDEITPETGRKIVDRVRLGDFSLIALHSAHWATPFVEAMNFRAREDAGKMFPPFPGGRIEFEFVPPPERYTVPEKDWRVTPHYYPRKFADGLTKVKVNLPVCCFPANRDDGKPSSIYMVNPGHPIAAGIRPRFTIPNTEMYDEPFHVPEPDTVIFEERWPTGEWFRSAMVWDIGLGKVVYLRPGHETYKVYFEEYPLKILKNAVRWLGKEN